MANVRLAVVFYSTYGTNDQMAEIAAEAARTAGADVRLLKVRETVPEAIIAGQPAWKGQAEKTAAVALATSDDMDWANAYMFSARRASACQPASSVGLSMRSVRCGRKASSPTKP